MAATAPSLPLAAPYLVQQDWTAYTPDQHAVWTELVGRRMPQLEEHACQEYLDGFHNIGLRQDHIPNLAKVNSCLRRAPAGTPPRSPAICRQPRFSRCSLPAGFPPR